MEMNCHNAEIRQQTLHLLLLYAQSLGGLGKVGWGQGQQHVRTGVLNPLQPSIVCNLCERGAISRYRAQHALYDQLALIGHRSRDTIGPLKDAALQPPKVVSIKGHCGRHHEVQEDA